MQFCEIELEHISKNNVLSEYHTNSTSIDTDFKCQWNGSIFTGNG